MDKEKELILRERVANVEGHLINISNNLKYVIEIIMKSEISGIVLNESPMLKIGFMDVKRQVEKELEEFRKKVADLVLGKK